MVRNDEKYKKKFQSNEFSTNYTFVIKMIHECHPREQSINTYIDQLFIFFNKFNPNLIGVRNFVKLFWDYFENISTLFMFKFYNYPAGQFFKNHQ